MTITEKTIATIIKRELKIVTLPHNLTMVDAGATNEDLRKIQTRFIKLFNKTVPAIYFSDTTQTIFDRLQK